MKPELRALLDEYAADHQHPLNRLTHKVGVPLIIFHILAMLDWARLDLSGGAGVPYGPSLGHLGALAVLGWYLRLDATLAAAVGAVGLLSLIASPFVPPLVTVGIAVFAWVLQLIGHGVYEGKRPSFTRNMVQLLVGPLFFAAVALGRYELPAAPGAARA